MRSCGNMSLRTRCVDVCPTTAARAKTTCALILLLHRIEAIAKWISMTVQCMMRGPQRGVAYLPVHSIRVSYGTTEPSGSSIALFARSRSYYAKYQYDKYTQSSMVSHSQIRAMSAYLSAYTR
eukprot:10821-Heterococcus_DN1.PRE.13